MRSGALVVTTAVYRSQCPCDRRMEIHRGDECPRCPGCEQDVDWAYQHSTYRPVEVDEPPVSPTNRLSAF
jgi:hypothetical protein